MSIIGRSCGLILLATLSLSSTAFAQSSGLTAGLSAIEQGLGVGAQAFGVGQEMRNWQQQPTTNYYQTGQPCFIRRDNQLLAGKFYPVQEDNGRIAETCVQVQP